MPTYHMIGWQLQSGAKHLLLGDSTHHGGDLVDSVMKYDAAEHGATPPLGCCCTEGEECPCGSTPTSFPSIGTTLTISFTNKTGDCTCLPDSVTLTYSISDMTGCGYTGVWFGQTDPDDNCDMCADEGGPVGVYILFFCTPITGFSPHEYQLAFVCPSPDCNITTDADFLTTIVQCQPLILTGTYTPPGGFQPCTGGFDYTITE